MSFVFESEETEREKPALYTPSVFTLLGLADHFGRITLQLSNQNVGRLSRPNRNKRFALCACV